MAYSHLFADSDILLDLLLDRNPLYTQILLYETEKRGLKLSTSALVIANIYYILSKVTGAANAKAQIGKLLNILNILPVESEVITLALQSNFKDFEDGVQYFVAKKYLCQVIITRNIKDYKYSEIPVLTALDFLKTL
jgi:predicted nucleic acid-binding protein